jgi:hypothetical protein
MSDVANIARFTETAQRLMVHIETYTATHRDRRTAAAQRAEGVLSHYRDRLGALRGELGLENDPTCCETFCRVRWALDAACGPRRAHYAAELARYDAELEADVARGAVIAASLGL